MYLKVYVVPGARKEAVEEKGEVLHIQVKEPAAGNRANTRVRELVALRLQVPVAAVRILSGHHTRGKMLAVNS